MSILLRLVSNAPRDMVCQKECTHALSLVSSNTLNVFLHNLPIVPFSHHVLLHTHNPPLLICTPTFSHNHGVPKYTYFTPMTLSSNELRKKPLGVPVFVAIGYDRFSLSIVHLLSNVLLCTHNCLCLLF